VAFYNITLLFRSTVLQFRLLSSWIPELMDAWVHGYLSDSSVIAWGFVSWSVHSMMRFCRNACFYHPLQSNEKLPFLDSPAKTAADEDIDMSRAWPRNPRSCQVVSAQYKMPRNPATSGGSYEQIATFLSRRWEFPSLAVGIDYCSVGVRNPITINTREQGCEGNYEFYYVAPALQSL
jgi:hypothetical protein